MPTPHYDIIIVGTGPAGLGTAFHLTDISPSLSILLVDREKICSGGLLNDCKQNYTGKGYRVRKDIGHATRTRTREWTPLKQEFPFPPGSGLFSCGNTHFPFSDLNNLEIADLMSGVLEKNGLH